MQPFSTMPKKLEKKNRIWELDFIRGLCVLLMIFDHTMYDIADIFGGAWYRAAEEAGKANAGVLHDLWQAAHEYYFASTQSTFWGVLSQGSPIRAFVEPLVVIIFAVVCGISCSFSRSNLKRGIELGIFAGLITLVTWLLDMEYQSMMITFGVFQMFTVAILLWCLIDFICRHDKIKTAMTCGIVGAIMLIINYVLVSIWLQDAKAFSDNSNGFFLGYFMLGVNKIPSADYQPIFPYVAWMLIGAAIGPMIYKNKKSLLPMLGKYDWYEPVNFWGRYAMWVYIAHQIVIGLILGLISVLLLTPGDFVII